MKILHTGDWHLGSKSDDEWIQNIQLDGIKQKIEYSKNNGINTWIQYGDIFDVRKAVTHTTMEFARKIADMIGESNITMHTIIGNHDAHYRNKLTPNAITELFGKYEHIKIYEKPQTVNFDNVSIDLIPWLCSENSKEIFDHIKTSSAEYCIGHWELNGFYFYKGLKSHGIEPDFLKKYKQVWSGHFHTISEAGNVKYIGTPWTLTAGDENDPRGFWIQDTSLGNFVFIPNKTTWHVRLQYPTAADLNFDDYKNKSVRVITTDMDKDFSKFESELEKVVYDLRIVSKIDNSVESDDDADIEVKSVIDIMYEYIDALEDLSEEDNKKLKKYANSLYVEAANLESI